MYYVDRMKKISIITLSAVLLFVAGCRKVQEEPVQEKELVETTTDMPQLITVTSGDIKVAEYYDGEINPSMQVLQFPRKGNFLEYKVLLGETVKKGQVVAVTKPECKQEIEDLNEHLEELRKDYNNQVTSYDLQIATNGWQAGQFRKIIVAMSPDMKGFDDVCISFELLLAEGEKIEVQKKQYMEKAEKEIAFQEAKLARLEAKNESNIIVAPQDGTIAYLADLKVGDPIGVNSYPVVLADTKRSLVQCEYIPAPDMEEVKFVYGVKDGKEYEMKYLPDEKGADTYTFFEVASPDESICFGEDIKVVMVTESKENVLILPTGCIRNDSGEDYVYCDVNGEKEAVTIEIGMSDEINTEILSGLEEGDIVYASN